jgi:hypothetical protein
VATVRRRGGERRFDGRRNGHFIKKTLRSRLSVSVASANSWASNNWDGTVNNQ